MPELTYTNSFYKNRNRDTEYAADKILGIIFEKYLLEIDSVIDIGCGVGTWLRIVKEKQGVSSILGLDGEYVPQEYMQIKKEEYIATDLRNIKEEVLIKNNKGNKFGLAICMEVAEHLDRKYAKEFVYKLCYLSDIVCFSAAIPQQGGDAHVNEQRLSYWKNLFEENGYVLQDIIRKEIWYDKKVPIWYRNNSVIFLNKKVFSKNLEKNDNVIDIVHPEMFEKKIRIYEKKIRELNESKKKYTLKRRIEKIIK